MKKSISILTALIMAVTMVFSCTTTVFAAAPESEQETLISYAVNEELMEGEPVSGNLEEAIEYAAEGMASTLQSCVISVTRNYEFAFEVLDLVNEERAAEGLSPLKMNKDMMEAAMLRASESAVLFSHTRPNGKQFNSVNSSLIYAENLAAKQTNPAAVMYSWMNSSGHRGAILTEEFKSIGIGVVLHNGNYFWAQEFGTKSQNSNCAKPKNSVVAQKISYHNEIYNLYEGGDASLYPEFYVADVTLTPGQVTQTNVRMYNQGAKLWSVFDSSCITYSLTDTSCAKIDKSTCKLTGLKEGATTLKATVNGVDFSKSIIITAPDKSITGHVGKPVSIQVSSAYDEAISTNKDYASVNIISKTQYSGAYTYKLEVIFSKPLTSQALLIKGANSSALMLLNATISDHTYREQGGTPATCTTPGKTAEKVCTICGDTVAEETEIPALGHDIVIKPAVEVTCTTNGKTEGEYCKRCGKTLVAQQTIKAEGHKMTSVDNGDGTRTETCSVCGHKETYGTASNVTRIQGSNRYDTAFKAADQLKKELGVNKLDYIIVADGSNYADALAGSYLAAVKGAPILLTGSTVAKEVVEYIDENLARYGTVYVLGGEGAVKSEWMEGCDAEIIRLGGTNRYDTNLLILEEAGVEVGSKIMVCTGTGFADSLSVSATGNPILLVANKLSDDQREFIETIGEIDSFWLIGGEGAVNRTVRYECMEYANVKRLNGEDRYATSALVAQYLFDNPDKAVLAYAQNFPDGLSAGPLAYTLKAPLLLTNTGAEYRAWKYCWYRDIRSGFVMGGPSLISDGSVRTILDMPDSVNIKLK